jgi:hypothetical protein
LQIAIPIAVVSHLTGRDAGNGETAKEAMQPIVERLYSRDETGGSRLSFVE